MYYPGFLYIFRGRGPLGEAAFWACLPNEAIHLDPNCNLFLLIFFLLLPPHFPLFLTIFCFDNLS